MVCLKGRQGDISISLVGQSVCQVYVASRSMRFIGAVRAKQHPSVRQYHLKTHASGLYWATVVFAQRLHENYANLNSIQMCLVRIMCTWSWRWKMSGQHHAPVVLSPGNNPRTYLMVGWVGPRARMECLEKRKISCLVPGLEPRFVHPLAPSLLPMMSGNTLHYSAMMKLKIKTEGVGRSVRCEVTWTDLECWLRNVFCFISVLLLRTFRCFSYFRSCARGYTVCVW
jgi:hypothetical protein